jgi:hypothetical protein
MLARAKGRRIASCFQLLYFLGPQATGIQQKSVTNGHGGNNRDMPALPKGKLSHD